MQENSQNADEPGTWVTDGTGTVTSSQARAALAGFAVLFFAGLFTIRPFLPALGWAVIFAVSLWPWQERLGRRWPRHRRMLIPALVTFLVFLAFILPLIMVISAIVTEVVALASWIAQVSAQGVAPPEFLKHLPFADHILVWWQANLSGPGALSHLSHTSSGSSMLQIDMGGRLLGGVLHRFLLVAFMLLTLFFLLRDGERMVQGLLIGTRRAFGPASEHVGKQIVQAIRGTVNGLVIVGFGEGLILGVAYKLGGVPHAALFGLLSALLSVVPLGSVIALAGAIGLLVAGGNIVPAVVIASLGGVVIFSADHFVRPALIGGATRLPFLWVLLGILGGIEEWGLIGLVLGPALIAALMLIWREWIGAQQGPLNPSVEA